MLIKMHPRGLGINNFFFLYPLHREKTFFPSLSLESFSCNEWRRISLAFFFFFFLFPADVKAKSSQRWEIKKRRVFMVIRIRDYTMHATGEKEKKVYECREKKKKTTENEKKGIFSNSSRNMRLQRKNLVPNSKTIRTWRKYKNNTRNILRKHNTQSNFRRFWSISAWCFWFFFFWNVKITRCQVCARAYVRVCCALSG